MKACNQLVGCTKVGCKRVRYSSAGPTRKRRQKRPTKRTGYKRRYETVLKNRSGRIKRILKTYQFERRHVECWLLELLQNNWYRIQRNELLLYMQEEGSCSVCRVMNDTLIFLCSPDRNVKRGSVSGLLFSLKLFLFVFRAIFLFLKMFFSSYLFSCF